MVIRHKEGFSVVDVIARMGDEKRYPTMYNIMKDIRKAKGASLEELANQSGVTLETVAKLERGSQYKLTNVRRYCEVLELSPETTRGILVEYTRRKQKELHQLYDMDEDEFALVVKAALDYYDKSVDDLSKLVRLSDSGKKAIQQGGVLNGERAYLSERKEIVEAFRTMLHDEHYGAHELLQDAKGSFSLKHFERQNRDSKKER